MAFYLSPLKKPQGKVWYSHQVVGQVVGYNTLASTVNHVCEFGGTSGYKTKHSLRMTSATQARCGGAINYEQD